MSIHLRQYNTTNNSFAYKIDGVPLEQVESYKDLEVDFLFDPFLLFDQHISNIVSKAYSMLGPMQRNFQELSRECFGVRMVLLSMRTHGPMS